MRIDFVITELHPGGAERCLTEIACGLSKRGDDVRVFSLSDRPEGDRAILSERLANAGIETEFSGLGSVRDLGSCLGQLSRFIKRSPPDVCQTFLFHANVLGSWVASRQKVACIVGGVRIAEHRGFRCLLERFAAKRMQSVVCVSEDVARFVSKKLRVPNEHLAVIPNGVDVKRFASGSVFDVTRLGWPEDATVLLFVGRMHPQKGLELLQGKVDQILSTLPDHASTQPRLLLVGEGPLAESIDDWISQTRSKLVQRLPWQKDVASLMRRCDLFVFPSRYEGMPNTVMEAMAAGKAVVSSRVEGIAELLGSDPIQTFEIGDATTMANSIEYFVGHPDERKKIGRANQTRMRDQFSIDAMVDAYRQHYLRLLDRRDDDNGR